MTSQLRDSLALYFIAALAIAVVIVGDGNMGTLFSAMLAQL